MQEISKIEQPISPKLSNDVIIKKIIDELEMCKKSAQQIRSFTLQWSRSNVVDHLDQEVQKVLDHHSLVVLDKIVSSLSMLEKCNMMSTTLGYESGNTSDTHHHDQSSTTKNRRGCYKRRRYDGDSRELEVTHLSDDGFAWRKYGQKQILNAKHPRSYYRCTYKHEQNCQATKLVQKISENNTTKYKIIYHGNHTCSDRNNNSPTIKLDDGGSPEDHYSSAVIKSFEGSNRVNNNPSNEYKQEILSVSSPPCSDLTATSGQSSSNFASEKSGVIISAVDQDHFCNEMEEIDYSCIMADDCSQLVLDWLV